jgi:site-specific DNA-methyltransferase (adenine-specific)
MEHKSYALLHGDCLEQMNGLDEGSIDLVCTDLPYGTTDNKWDSVIPLDRLWACLKRVCRPGAPIVLFTQQPFTTALAASNLKQLRTEWIWRKSNATGFLNARKYPLKKHENILVFCDRVPTYNPQKTAGAKPYPGRRTASSSNYRFVDRTGSAGNQDGTRYPTTILEFNSDRGLHPTQKPVALVEYLIRTYSNEGDVVLDCTMGSGTAGEAALRSRRRFVGIERDPEYFAIANKRIGEAIHESDSGKRVTTQ